MKVLFTRGTTLKWGSISILRSFLFFDVKAHLAYLVTLRFVQKIYAFESNKQTKAGDGLNGKG